MPYAAFEVHGLSAEFLRDKPRFAELADEMLAFIDGAMLVMHNAAFDFGFLNAELDRMRASFAALGLRGRYAGACAAAAPRRTVQPRCALQALRHRPLRAREAWRSARLPAARARLCRARWRAPGAARVCRQWRAGRLVADERTPRAGSGRFSRGSRRRRSKRIAPSSRRSAPARSGSATSVR